MGKRGKKTQRQPPASAADATSGADAARDATLAPAPEADSPLARGQSVWTLAARRGWPLLVIVGLVCFLYWDMLFAHKVLCMRDMVCDNMSYRRFAADALRHGAFPLWNPYSSCGQPFMAEPQTAVLYPPHALFYLLPATLALKLSLLLHLGIAATSFYALARHWRLAPGPSLVGAVGFTFSTLTICAMEFMSLFETLVWCPVTLLLASRFIEHWRARANQPVWPLRVRACFPDVLALALALAIEFLAGYPQTLLLNLVIVAAYILARSIGHRSLGLLGASVAAMAVAGVTALCLSMPQFLLTWELIPLSQRSAKIDPDLDFASASARHLLTFVFPFLLGRPGIGRCYWAPSMAEFWIGTCYIGLAPLVLASFSPLCLRRRPGEGNDSRRVLFGFSLGLVVFGLLMAAGKYTPLYMLLFDHLPVFNQMRWPSKFLQLVLVGLSILAALGYQELLEPDTHSPTPFWRRPQTLILALWAAALALAVGGYVCAQDTQNGDLFFRRLTGHAKPFDSGQRDIMVKDWQMAILWLALGLAAVSALAFRWLARSLAGAVVLAVAYFNLCSVDRPMHLVTADDIYDTESAFMSDLATTAGVNRAHTIYNLVSQQSLYGSHDRNLFLWAKKAGVGETSLPLGIFKTWGGGELRLDKYAALFILLADLAPQERERLADLLNMRYLITGETDAEKLYRGAVPRDVCAVERPTCLPRALLVGKWREIGDLPQAFRTLLNPSFDPMREAVIEKGESCADEDGLTTAPGQVGAIRYGWNRVEIEAQATRRCLLLLNDTWYPGWKAAVDGQPAPILRANMLFRGIILAPGQHKIVFLYAPWLFKLGWIIAALTALGLAAGYVLLIRRPGFAVASKGAERPVSHSPE